MFYIPPPLSHAGDCHAATPLAMTFTHIPVIARRAKPDEAIPCNRKAQLLYPPHAGDCRAATPLAMTEYPK